jgi:hypothetical protein
MNRAWRHARTGPRREAGSALSKLILVILVITVGLPMLTQCLSRAPQVAGELAGNAARAAGQAAGNAVTGALSGFWDALTDPVEDAWTSLKQKVAGPAKTAQQWWDDQPPPEKFRILCQLAGEAQKICEYFAHLMETTDDAQTERVTCLWQAAARMPNGSDQMVHIANACAAHPDNPNQRGTPSTVERCLLGQVQSRGGDVSQCLASAPGMFWNQTRAMLKPVYCPEDLPVENCFSDQIRESQGLQPAKRMRTDQNYLNCLTHYRDVTRNRSQDGCGNPNGTVTPQNAACVQSALLRVQNGAEFIQHCERQPGG